MRRLLLGLLFMALLAGTAWGQNDKSFHFAWSGVMSLATDKTLSEAYPVMDPWARGTLAVFLALIPGVIKESTDSKFDGMDMAANAAGAITGVIFGENTGRIVFFEHRENSWGLAWRLEW